MHKERKREKQTLTMLPPFSVCIPSRHHPVDTHTQNTCRRILHTVFLFYHHVFLQRTSKIKKTQNAIINTHFFLFLSLVFLPCNRIEKQIWVEITFPFS